MRSSIKESRLWQTIWRNRLDAGLFLFLFAGAFALYARTVTPGVLAADGGEFQTNIYRLGVSHTGYPLYFLLAKFWTLIVPVGTIAYRANLFSSFFGAVVVAFLYPTLRVLVRSRGAALFASVLFGVSRVEWSQALIPDVYTLNSFFIVLLVLLAVLYRAGRISPVWLAFAFGLSLTHHRTIMWFAPALGILLLLGEGWGLFRPRRLFTLALAFALPLLLYLYIPLSGESDVGVEYHATGFAEMILASNVSISLRFGPPGFLWERLTTVYLPLMVEQFTVVGFLFGLVGIVGMARGRAPRGWPARLDPRQMLLFIGLAHLVETAFAIVFWVVDSEIFFIPSYLTYLFFVAVGLAFAFDWLAGVADRGWGGGPRPYTMRYGLPLLLALALLLLTGWLGWSNFPRVDRSWDDEADLRWQEVLAQPIERGAWIAGNWEDLTPLEYYQYVEGRRTDLKKYKLIIHKDQLKLAPQGDVGEWVGERLAAGDHVYFTRHPSDTETLDSVSERFDLLAMTSLWRPQNKREPAPSELGTVVGQDLVLETLDSPHGFYRAGNFTSWGLGWWVREGSEKDYSFSLRLTDVRGNVWAQRDGITLQSNSARQLALDDPQVYYWSPPPEDEGNEWARPWLDQEGIIIPPDAPPGNYWLELQVQDVEKREPVAIDDKPWLRLELMQVQAATENPPLEAFRIPHATNIKLGSAQLLGYGLPDGERRTGDKVDLQLWWQGLSNGSDLVEIGLIDGQGATSVLARDSLTPAPRHQFNPQQIIRSHMTMQLPPSAALGRARLTITLNGQRSEFASFDLLPGNRLLVPPTIKHAQKARLGADIEFLGYNLERTSYRAGDKASLTLFWHAIQPLPSSYKVFVHLLNRDGALVAQQDGLPRGGELPTDRWLAGEYIADSYYLDLPGDLPTGDYRLEIGMYPQEGGDRLPIVDAEGRPLEGNRILLETPLQVTR